MIRVRQVKIEVISYSLEKLYDTTLKKLKIPKAKILDLKIVKQSIDARNKNMIFYVFEVDIKVDNEKEIVSSLNNPDIFIAPEENYKFIHDGTVPLKTRPIIIGSGPAGLFTAFILAENGYKPIIFERGKMVEDRIIDVQTFWDTGVLNPESNVQFGEGGAGTFSDGKLNTLISDDNYRFHKVFNTFVKFGANSDILYSYKPHIGTDILQVVVKNMREEIIKMGGEFYFNSTLTNIIIDNNHINKIVINNKDEYLCDVLVLALGHSSRDTFKMLYDAGLNMIPKSFAVGFRVIHSQSMIDESQYGKKYQNILHPATYKLTYRSTNNRGVYSFCMCPGGYVVNSSSETNHTVINGMSYHDRGSSTANSAIIVTVNPEDFGPSPMDAIEFQRELERKTYELGKGYIPVTTLKDYLLNQSTTSLSNIDPNFKGKYKLTNLNGLLPKELEQAFKESFASFGRKIKGFDNPETIIAAIESRTSSPIRMERTSEFESNIEGIYPCGEGAGYAGGITSSAIDGIKVAEAIGHKFYLSK